MGEGRQSDERPPRSAPSRGPGLGAAISVAVGLGALGGSIAYAIMRYSYQRFYNEFGLTPDDVGPSSAAALTQSGVGVAAFVALFAILPLTLALLVSSGCGRAVRADSSDTLDRRRVLLDLVIRLVAALGVYRLFTYATGGHWERVQLYALAIAVLLLSGKRYAKHVPLADRLPTAPWIVAALMIVVGVLVLANSLPVDAERTALCTISHPSLPVRSVHTHRTFPGLGHIPVLRVRADPAAVAPIGGTSPAAILDQRLPHRFIYLGEESGREFLFAVKECETLQIPTGAVAVLTAARSTHCHWWTQGPMLRPCG